MSRIISNRHELFCCYGILAGRINGMDKAAICEALKKLRESKFPKKEDMRQATRINISTITETEKGLNLPNVLFIKKWVNACGSTLAEFFAELEPQPEQERKVKSELSISIQKTNKKLHEKLEEILDGGGDPAAWISGNITVFHNDHVRNARKPK